MNNTKYKTTKSKMVLIFCILFILGGIVSIAASAVDVSKVVTAKYKVEATANVISKEVKNNRIENSDIKKTRTDSFEWITQEEIEIDGQIIQYEGHYYVDPEGEITHTLISKDGVNWEVNDSDSETLIFSFVAGIICIIIGAFALRFA
jgi:hypothetical protein